MTSAERLTESPARRIVIGAVMSLLAGMATLFAQDVLPDSVVSFANSASGWTLVTVLVVAWARVRTVLAALLGAVSFVLLTLGYSAAAYTQDLTYDPTLFAVVGVVVGPFVGIAASWLRAESARQVAAGTALLSGVGLGESAYGLTVVSDTTSPVYWALIGLVGLALLVAMLVRRIRGVWWMLLAGVGTIAVAGTFVVVYSTLGGV